MIFKVNFLKNGSPNGFRMRPETGSERRGLWKAIFLIFCWILAPRMSPKIYIKKISKKCLFWEQIFFDFGRSGRTHFGHQNLSGPPPANISFPFILQDGQKTLPRCFWGSFWSPFWGPGPRFSKVFKHMFDRFRDNFLLVLETKSCSISFLSPPEILINWRGGT